MMMFLLGVLVGVACGYGIGYWRLCKVLRVVRNVVGERRCDQEARTPCHPGHDNYHQGWNDCAGLLRGRLKRALGIRLS